MTSDKTPSSTPAQRKRAKLSVGLLGGGVVIFSVALLSGSQGTIVAMCPVGLLLVLASCVTAFPIRGTTMGKTVIKLGVAGLIVGGLVLAFSLILAIGFSSIR